MNREGLALKLFAFHGVALLAGGLAQAAEAPGDKTAAGNNFFPNRQRFSVAFFRARAIAAPSKEHSQGPEPLGNVETARDLFFP